MRFAVVGSRGLLGTELVRFLNENGHDVVGFDRSNIDIHALAAQEIVERLVGFDIIVNAAAFTRVDDAEIEIVEANSVNAIAAGKLAQASALTGARFVQISTDYVFNGVSSRPYLTSDAPDPQTEYGRSKARGELLVSESGADYAIIRTAWLYGSTGKCFPKTIANVLERNGSARVVDDQHGQPTWTRDLAKLIVACAELSEMPRMVHGTSSGLATWSEFAGEVAQSLGLDPAEVIVPVSSTEYESAAVRPKWSVLDNSSVLIKPIGDWRERWRIAADEVLASR